MSRGEAAHRPRPAPQDRRERRGIGLTSVYGWYERDSSLAGCMVRDVEYHRPTQEIVELRFRPFGAACHEVPGAKLTQKQRALLHLALSYFAWRALVREADLKPSAAVKTRSKPSSAPPRPEQAFCAPAGASAQL